MYGYIVLAVFSLLIIVTAGLFECCKRTLPEEHDRAHNGAQDVQDRSENGAQSDAQGGAENRPQTELKALLSPPAKDADSSV